GLYLASVFAAFWLGPSVVRRRLLAFLLLALAMYALVAAGRGNLFLVGAETTPFATAATLRYHYAALVPLIVVSCLILGALGERFPLPARVRDGLLFAVLGIQAIGFRDTDWHIDQWTIARDQAGRLLDAVHVNTRSARPDAAVYLPARHFGP